MVTIVEYYCYSVACVVECLLINCVAVLDHFVVVAVIVAYLVVQSFVVKVWTYFVVIFVNFEGRYDGSGLSCSW